MHACFHTLFTPLDRSCGGGSGDCILESREHSHRKPDTNVGKDSIGGEEGKETRGSTTVRGDKGLLTLSLGEVCNAFCLLTAI